MQQHRGVPGFRRRRGPVRGRPGAVPLAVTVAAAAGDGEAGRGAKGPGRRALLQPAAATFPWEWDIEA